MISFGPQVRVFVATQPIDFRIGVHGLVALVAQGLCEFRFNPATDSDLKPAGVPI